VSTSVSITLSSSATTATVSTSVSITPSSSATTATVSTSVSITLSSSATTATVSITSSSSATTATVSNSVSTVTPSYTYTRSSSLVNYFAPGTVSNDCANARATICFVWPASVGTVTYTSFNIRYGLGYYTYIYDIPSNFYTITGLQQNTQYYIEIQGQVEVDGTIIMSPWSDLLGPFTTPAVGPDGVSNIICDGSISTVACAWNIGTVEPTVMKVLLYCPYYETTILAKKNLHHGENTVTFTGVPKDTTVCRVDFKIRYENYHHAVAVDVFAYF